MTEAATISIHAQRPPAYSSAASEYAALTQHAGLLDSSSYGRLVYSGEDAQDLINRLSTNELMTLEEGTGATTVLTSNKGRIVDVLYVLRRKNDLLVLTSPYNSRKVVDWIDFYTIIEDVEVADVTGTTAMLSVAGPKAAEELSKLTGEEVASLGPNSSIEASIAGVGVTVLSADFFKLPGYELISPVQHKAALWAIVETVATPIGTETEDAVRIEQGVPAYGRELSEEYNPLEAGLIDHISFSKGCYIGQEVVARLNTYQKVQKYLIGLSWDTDVPVAPGAKLTLDGKQVGLVTSAAVSPADGAGVGLGYVRKAQATEGTRLSVEDGDGDVQVVATQPVSE